MTGWGALGLASARHNPRDVHRKHGRSVSRYLAASPASMSDIGSIERTILVLKSAGLSPRKFAGRDLVAKVKAKRRKDGSIAGFVSYTAFGVLALRAAGQTGVSAQARYLVRAQASDGGFGIATSAASDPDMTGAVLQALAAAGRATGGVKSRAVSFLRARQNADGGFGALRGASSNAQSTAYAVQGLVAAHAGSEVAARAIAYLKRLQRADGSIRYSRTSAQTPVWVTAQALMALRRKPLPIATAPRRKHRSHASAAADASHTARKGARGAHVLPGTAKAKTETKGPNGERSAAAGHAAARTPGLDDSTLKTDPPRKTRLAAHSGKGVPGWLVVLAIALALAAVFLMRRRLGRFIGVSRPA